MGAGATIDALRVTADFPHGLRIEVVEKAPVAVLVSASDRVAVGAGGVRGPALASYGTNSSAPMSQLAPVGRGLPSKSVVGAPVQVPVSMHGEPGPRCMSFGATKRGLALM